MTMGSIDQINLLSRIHHMIELKCNGSPAEFAHKLGVSERTLFRKLEELRDSGIEIRYASERRSYVYLNNTRIRVEMIKDESETKSVKGGFAENFNISLPELAVEAWNFVPDNSSHCFARTHEESAPIRFPVV